MIDIVKEGLKIQETNVHSLLDERIMQTMGRLEAGCKRLSLIFTVVTEDFNDEAEIGRKVKKIILETPVKDFGVGE